MKQFCLTALCLILGTSAFAQFKTRQDDHFWRKRVVNRISMVEKINKPLVNHVSHFYSEGGQYPEQQGLVVSLINGVKAGQYTAYDPDNGIKPMSYQELVDRMNEFDQAMGIEEEYDEEDTETSPRESEWGDDWEVSSSDEAWASPFEEEVSKASVAAPEPEVVDYGPYEEVIHMVEDWVFDRTRSSMVYNIDFFEIIWVDPSGLLPEKVLARFKWDEVRTQLEKTQWKNRFNDAQVRSMAEVFELRLFNSILINVGGEPIRTLQEAERRRQELLEFEHHLWSY
ncbi:MAG: hypothetical protein AAF206_11040 [Bacteroidota bacterium]